MWAFRRESTVFALQKSWQEFSDKTKHAFYSPITVYLSISLPENDPHCRGLELSTRKLSFTIINSLIIIWIASVLLITLVSLSVSWLEPGWLNRMRFSKYSTPLWYKNKHNTDSAWSNCESFHFVIMVVDAWNSTMTHWVRHSSGRMEVKVDQTF